MQSIYAHNSFDISYMLEGKLRKIAIKIRYSCLKNGFPNDEIPKSNLLRKLKFLYSGNHLLISCAARNAFPGVVKEKINSAKLIIENTDNL